MSHAEKHQEIATIERNRREAARIRKAFRDTFGSADGTFKPTEAGRIILGTLHASARAGFPSFLPSADGSYCPIAAAFRDGRKSVLLEIDGHRNHLPDTGEKDPAPKPRARGGRTPQA